MKTIIRYFLLSTSVFVPSTVFALTFGVFPQYQPMKLAELNAPLINYLNQTLPEPVYFRTANDFFSFKQRADSQSYDVVMIAPNLGYNLIHKGLYHPLLQVVYRPQAVFVVPKNSPIQSLKDLKDKRISFPPNLAVTTKVAYKKLAEKGISVSIFQAMNRKSHLESLRWLALHKSDAAVLTRAVWEARSKEERDNYRVVGYSGTAPGIFLLVKEPKWIEPVKQALQQFEQTSAGQQYFNATKLLGYKPITDKDMKELEGLYQ